MIFTNLVESGIGFQVRYHAFGGHAYGGSRLIQAPAGETGFAQTGVDDRCAARFSVLIELASDPDRMSRFVADPGGELDGAGLSTDEKAVLLARDSARLRRVLGASPVDHLTKILLGKTAGKKAGKKKPRRKKKPSKG